MKAAIKSKEEKKVEFDPFHRARKNAREFVSQRRIGLGQRCACLSVRVTT